MRAHAVAPNAGEPYAPGTMTRQDSDPPTLYFTPDTCALASLIACYDAGVEPDMVHVDFSSAQQKSDAYLSLNPKARVPALRVGGTVLTETPAILAYLSQAHPYAGLAPSDPVGFAQVQSFNAYLCSRLHFAHAHRMRGYRWVDGEEHEEAMRRKVPEAMTDCYDYIERHAFEGPFVFGETYTICDPYLFTIAQWMKSDGVDGDLFPKLSAHQARMAKRPNVARALMIERGFMASQS